MRAAAKIGAVLLALAATGLLLLATWVGTERRIPETAFISAFMCVLWSGVIAGYGWGAK